MPSITLSSSAAADQGVLSLAGSISNVSLGYSRAAPEQAAQQQAQSRKVLALAGGLGSVKLQVAGSMDSQPLCFSLDGIKLTGEMLRSGGQAGKQVFQLTAGADITGCGVTAGDAGLGALLLALQQAGAQLKEKQQQAKSRLLDSPLSFSPGMPGSSSPGAGDTPLAQVHPLAMSTDSLAGAQAAGAADGAAEQLLEELQWSLQATAVDGFSLKLAQQEQQQQQQEAGTAWHHCISIKRIDAGVHSAASSSPARSGPAGPDDLPSRCSTPGDDYASSHGISTRIAVQALQWGITTGGPSSSSSSRPKLELLSVHSVTCNIKEVLPLRGGKSQLDINLAVGTTAVSSSYSALVPLAALAGAAAATAQQVKARKAASSNSSSADTGRASRCAASVGVIRASPAATSPPSLKHQAVRSLQLAAADISISHSTCYSLLSTSKEAQHTQHSCTLTAALKEVYMLVQPGQRYTGIAVQHTEVALSISAAAGKQELVCWQLAAVEKAQVKIFQRSSGDLIKLDVQQVGVNADVDMALPAIAVAQDAVKLLLTSAQARAAAAGGSSGAGGDAASAAAPAAAETPGKDGMSSSSSKRSRKPPAVIEFTVFKVQVDAVVGEQQESLTLHMKMAKGSSQLQQVLVEDLALYMNSQPLLIAPYLVVTNPSGPASAAASTAPATPDTQRAYPRHPSPVHCQAMRDSLGEVSYVMDGPQPSPVRTTSRAESADSVRIHEAAASVTSMDLVDEVPLASLGTSRPSRAQEPAGYARQETRRAAARERCKVQDAGQQQGQQGQAQAEHNVLSLDVWAEKVVVTIPYDQQPARLYMFCELWAKAVKEVRHVLGWCTSLTACLQIA